MENKYYTPSIEEFFVGFEFEKYDDRKAHYLNEGLTNWHKHIYDLKSIRLSQLPTHLYNNTIRVKYLDASDIEEFLNIKPKLGESYIFLKDVNFRPNWLIGVYAHKIRIFFNPLTKWLKVEYLLTGNEEFEKFFEGSVKNKSEFIKLLRFLGYE